MEGHPAFFQGLASLSVEVSGGTRVGMCDGSSGDGKGGHGQGGGREGGRGVDVVVGEDAGGGGRTEGRGERGGGRGGGGFFLKHGGTLWRNGEGEGGRGGGREGGMMSGRLTALPKDWNKIAPIPSLLPSLPSSLTCSRYNTVAQLAWAWLVSAAD